MISKQTLLCLSSLLSSTTEYHCGSNPNARSTVIDSKRNAKQLPAVLLKQLSSDQVKQERHLCLCKINSHNSRFHSVHCVRLELLQNLSLGLIHLHSLKLPSPFTLFFVSPIYPILCITIQNVLFIPCFMRMLEYHSLTFRSSPNQKDIILQAANISKMSHQ